MLDAIGIAVAGIEVADDQLAGGVRQAGYIPLNIGDIIVSGAGGGTIGRIGQGQGRAGSSVGNQRDKLRNVPNLSRYSWLNVRIRKRYLSH